MPTGLWKEGRSGAASLCYWQLSLEQQSWVLAHHQAVGIRATLAVSAGETHPHECGERNWDCALLEDASATDTDPAVEAGRICLQAPPYPASLTSAAYLVQLCPGRLATPQAVTAAALPSQYLPPRCDLAQVAIESVVQQQAWAIWHCDGTQLAALGRESHRQLLSWLGDHHARIWCAPVFDIVRWVHGA